jgi:hypothetical protein
VAQRHETRKLKRRRMDVEKKKKSFTMIPSSVIKTLETFQNQQKKETMYEFYERHHADPEVLKLVSLENKQFGTMIENMIKELFHLQKATKTSYDSSICNGNKKLRIEIKSSRYWRSSNKIFFKWQHIMREHDYDVLLFIGLDFHGMKVYAIAKKDLMSLSDQNIVRQQGGAEGQGMWATSEEISPYLTPISSTHDWFVFVKSLY